MKNLIKVNIITVILLILSLLIWTLYGMTGFLIALIFSAVVAVYLNYNALRKKEIRLDQYINSQYRQEILRIQQAEASLLSRRDFFESYSSGLRQEYEDGLAALEQQKQRARDFLSSYDFVVEREQSPRMREIADNCEELVRRMNDAAEAAIDRQAGVPVDDTAAQLGEHIQSLERMLTRASEWEPQMTASVSGILKSLREIKKENQLQNYSKLFSYYLPTTEKLIRVYQDLADMGDPGANMREIKSEVVASMALVNDAVRAMKDKSYEYKALDVAAERSVLQTMMKQDNLSS